MSERRRAVLALVLAAVFWSLGGVLIKWVRWNPMAIAGSRSALAAVLLGAVLVFRARRGGGRVFGEPIARHEWWGAFAYAGTVLLFVVATKWTTAANAILLQYTAPVWVALLSGPMLGERATRLDFAVVAAVLGGMALFFYEGLSSGGFAGDVVAALSGVAFALLALTMRQQRGGALRAIVLGNVLAAAIGLPFALAPGPLPDAEGWAALVVMGAVQLALPYLLYAWAVSHVSALEIILIPIIEPLLNPVWAALRFGELPGALSLVGGAIVLGAVTLRALLRARAGAAG